MRRKDENIPRDKIVSRRDLLMQIARLGVCLPLTGSLRPLLSATQLATLAEHGEERTAAVGDTLFELLANVRNDNAKGRSGGQLTGGDM